MATTVSTKNMLESALNYLARGWSVIPVTEKEPLIEWKQYQDRRPSEEELEAWFSEYPNASVAVVTGKISGLVVLDIDPRHGGHETLKVMLATHGALPPMTESVTGSGGLTLSFKHPGIAICNDTGRRLSSGLDVWGDGRYVVIPPSIHKTGKRYEWRVSTRRVRSGGDAGVAPHALAGPHSAFATDTYTGRWAAGRRGGAEYDLD